METRADRYCRMGADDKLRATQLTTHSKKAFEEGAHTWLKLADDVDRMDRVRVGLVSPSNKRSDPR